MAKIQVTTVQKQANVQVIELNSSFVIKAFRAYSAISAEEKRARHDKKIYNEEKKKFEPALDENGERIAEWQDFDAEPMVTEVLPFLKELVDALEQ